MTGLLSSGERKAGSILDFGVLVASPHGGLNTLFHHALTKPDLKQVVLQKGIRAPEERKL